MCIRDRYQTLERVFDEQFETAGDGTLVLKESKQVGGRSVQSPHDTDCTFRDKGGNKVKGYSINVTETLSLIHIFLDATMEWAKVSYTDSDGKKLIGWIEIEWLCGNPYTTCP